MHDEKAAASSAHSNDPASVETNENDADEDVELAAGPAVIEVCGGVVSRTLLLAPAAPPGDTAAALIIVMSPSARQCLRSAGRRPLGRP